MSAHLLLSYGNIDGGETLAPGKERHKALIRVPVGSGLHRGLQQRRTQLNWVIIADYLANQWPAACHRKIQAQIAWNLDGGGTKKSTRYQVLFLVMETQKKGGLTRGELSWYCRWKRGISVEYEPPGAQPRTPPRSTSSAPYAECAFGENKLLHSSSLKHFPHWQLQ